MSDEDVKLVFTVVGGLLGIIAFGWNLLGYLWTYAFSHLQLDISCQQIQQNNVGKIKVSTIIENKGSIAKKIDFAFLFIMPEDKSFRDSLQLMAKNNGVEKSNPRVVELLQFFCDHGSEMNGKIVDTRFAMYLLPYFYEDQIQVGNEKIKYCKLIDLEGFQKDQAFHIRFVTISKYLFKTYLRHRSTSDLFIN